MTDTTSLRELPAKWQADAFAVVAAYGPGSDYGQALQMCIDDLNAALSARDAAGAWTVDRLTVEIEKRLCAILGRKWSAAGISIESLLAEVARRLAARAEPQAGGAPRTFDSPEALAEWLDGLYEMEGGDGPLTDRKWDVAQRARRAILAPSPASRARPEAQGEACETCGGRGEVGGNLGQTPESFDLRTEPCPDCSPPADRAPGEVEGAAGDGVALIAAERQRQVAAEGWTPEHDDEHANAALAQAAGCYALDHALRAQGDAKERVPAPWPWAVEWWKPTPNDPIRQLVKAGALIAAEIDRLQRAALTHQEPAR